MSMPYHKKYVTGPRGRLTTSERIELQEFYENVEGSPDAPWRCEECGEPFWDIDEWQAHHMEEHFDGF